MPQGLYGTGCTPPGRFGTGAGLVFRNAARRAAQGGLERGVSLIASYAAWESQKISNFSDFLTISDRRVKSYTQPAS